MKGVTIVLLAVATLALGSPARAGEEPSERARLTGEARAGWRFVDDEDEGRFPQDFGLQDGPRLFDLRLTAESLDDAGPFDLAEFTAGGVGDRETDYRLRLRGEDGLDLHGGWSRDVSSYRASGDPFPYDTEREHGFFRARYAPRRDFAIRLGWERRTRRGTAFVQTDTDLRGFTNPPPAGVDADIVSQRRPLDHAFDTYTLGVDGGSGPWSYGLTQTVDLTRIDDERAYDVPAANRTGGPIRESLERHVRAKAYTTRGKVAGSFLNDSLDATLIASTTRLPLDTRISGSTAGWDDLFSGGAPLGQFRGTLDGANRTERRATAARGEVSWRPVEELEFVLSGEWDEVVDDASLALSERRVYAQAGTSPRTIERRVEARITDRTDRWAAEAAWDVNAWVRVRLGEEYHRQDVTSPTDTHGSTLLPTVHRSRTNRHMVGLDVKPFPFLHMSTLARFGENDRPHAAGTTSFEQSDEIVYRGRYRPSDHLSVTSLYRYTGFRQDDDIDARTNAESATLGVVWNDGPWVVSAQGGVHWHETETQTSFFTGFVQTTDKVRYRTRDTIVSLDVRRELTPGARAFFTGTYVESHGTYAAEYHDLALGGEVDLGDAVSLDATLRSFRLAERDETGDDYDVLALEIALTYRF